MSKEGIAYRRGRRLRVLGFQYHVGMDYGDWGWNRWLYWFSKEYRNITWAKGKYKK
jgi:hypothetical protein